MKIALVVTLGLLASSVWASDSPVFSSSLDYAQVIQVKANQSRDGSWCFAVSVRHNDEGWNHYANAWQVTDLKGNKLGVRRLAHPHENEQPFTRSRCHIKIPKNLSKIIIKAKCNQHGFGGRSAVIDLPTLRIGKASK